MKSSRTRHVLALLSLFFVAVVRADEAPKELQAIADKMFDAVDKESFERFVADGDKTWQRLNRGEFDRLTSQLRPKMKGGYGANYLGQIMRSDGVQQTLWKLTLKGNVEELLVTIDVKDGKVTRFGVPRL